MQDNNAVRGQWQMGIVKETYPGNDGRVRNVKVGCKDFPVAEPADVYRGSKFTIVDRPVHCLIVLIAIDDNYHFCGGSVAGLGPLCVCF